MNIIDEMQSYYDQRAPIYDESMGYTEPDKLTSLQPIIEFIGAEIKNQTVIEIACGPGFWTQYLSQFAKKILATDFNQSTLDRARRKNISPNLVSFQQVDAYKLTGVKGPFSAAMGVDWLAHVPKSRMDNFLQGLHNLLKPGSKVIFCDELQGESPLTKGIFDSDGNHIQKRTLPNGTSYKVIKNYMLEEEIEAILRPYSDEIKITKFAMEDANKWSHGRIVITYFLK